MRGNLSTQNPLIYFQLTQHQRTQFEIHKALGTSTVEIAKILDVHFSTLYREARRNRDDKKAYNSCTAQDLAQTRKAIPRSPTKCTPENEILIGAQLKMDFSPDVISGRAKLTGQGPQLCTNTIYKIVELNRNNGGDLYKMMPRQGRNHRKNRTGTPNKCKLKVRSGQELEDRPAGINERREPGHLEIDLMFSGGTVWLTGVDRFTRNVTIRALSSKESEPIAEEIYLIFEKGGIRSMTTDRGLEWAQINPYVVDLLKQKLNVYFCNPYSSWEKGSVENVNRLLRRYFPKGKNLEWSENSAQEAIRVEDLMNHRPRKILNYRTPAEVEKEWKIKRRKAAWKQTMGESPSKAA